VVTCNKDRVGKEGRIVASDEEIQWQPIERLGDVLALIDGMVEESREQRELFRDAGVATLDQATVSRTRRAYSDRLGVLGLFRRQLERWGKERSSPDQTKRIKNAQRLLDEDERIAREILGIVGYHAPFGQDRRPPN
jgi:hypothetical protein